MECGGSPPPLRSHPIHPIAPHRQPALSTARFLQKAQPSTLSSRRLKRLPQPPQRIPQIIFRMNLKRMPPLRRDIRPRPQPQIPLRTIRLRFRHRLQLKNNRVRRPNRPRHRQRRKHRPAAVIPQHPEHRPRRHMRPCPHFFTQHRAQIFHLFADPRHLRPWPSRHRTSSHRTRSSAIAATLRLALLLRSYPLVLGSSAQTRSPCYCAATGMFAGPPGGMTNLGSVTACTCSIVVSGAISRSTRPSGVTSIHASSVMM
jgi:hypothetical protein